MRNKFLLQFATGSVSKMQQALSQLTARTTNCDNMLLHFAIDALLQKARALSQFTHVLQSVPTVQICTCRGVIKKCDECCYNFRLVVQNARNVITICDGRTKCDKHYLNFMA